MKTTRGNTTKAYTAKELRELSTALLLNEFTNTWLDLKRDLDDIEDQFGILIGNKERMSSVFRELINRSELTR